MIRLLLFFGALSLVAAQGAAPDYLAHIQTGVSAEKLGRHDAAIAEFRKAAELDPSQPAAYIDLGAVYLGGGRYPEAVAALKRAVEINPTILQAQDMLGYALLSQGYATEAVPYFQAANNKGGLGTAQLQSGDVSDALVNLQAGLAEHPDDPNLLFGLARASGLLSQQAKDTLLSTHPDSAQAHAAIAGDYWALKRNGDAEMEYRKALAFQPALPGMHLALGAIYEVTRQWDKAEREFDAEAKFSPGSAEAAYRLGNAFLENGKIPAAAAELKRADSLQPDMPETLYALGKAEAADGELSSAEKTWVRLLALETNTALAKQTHFSLAGIYRRLGRSADSQREMEEFDRMRAAEK